MIAYYENDISPEEKKRIEKLTDVTVDKRDDAGGNVTTYALGVGKNFSISRIVAR